MKMQDVLTKVQGKPITVQDVVDLLKVNGVFRNTIYKLIEMEVIQLHADRQGITLTEEELEAFNESKRRMMGLTSAMAFNSFCRMHGIRPEQWKTVAAHELLKQKIKTNLVTDKEVQAYFQAHRHELRMTCLARIVVHTREEADEIKERVLREDADFSTLARQYSLENTSRIAGGYLGCFKQGSLPPAIDQAILVNQVKSILGPFHQNGFWALYRIEEIIQAELNDMLKSQLADKLFNDWLNQEVRNAKTT